MLMAIPRVLRGVRDIPESARTEPQTSVFDDLQATTLETDAQFWWYRSKAAFVAEALRGNLPAGSTDSRLLDIGAGPGGVTAMLGWKPDRLFSVEGSQPLCRRARDLHALLATTAAAEQLPFPDSSFRVVTLLDVIEHLADPGTILREAWRVLDDEGLLVVNVPGHQWLWSGHDEVLGHVRRYTRSLVREQLAGSAFEPLWLSHVFSWLVPPVWLYRRLTRDPRGQAGHVQDSMLVDRTALVLTRIERAVARRVPLPIGTSILCVAAKAPRPFPARPQYPGMSTSTATSLASGVML